MWYNILSKLNVTKNAQVQKFQYFGSMHEFKNARWFKKKNYISDIKGFSNTLVDAKEVPSLLNVTAKFEYSGCLRAGKIKQQFTY